MSLCMLRSTLAIATLAAMTGTAVSSVVFEAGINQSGSSGPTFSRNSGDRLRATGGDIRLALYDRIATDTFVFTTSFTGEGTISDYQSTDLGGGQTLHAYAFDGQFTFRDRDTGVDLLTIDISGGVFTALGTADAWGSSSTIQGSTIAGAGVTYTWGGSAIAELGLEAGTVLGDSSFTFGNTERIAGSDDAFGVSLGADGLPDEQWTADTVFAGRSENIPTPATLSLLLSAGLIASRRKR